MLSPKATSAGDQAVPRRPEVFISYSRKDKEFVRRLDEELKARGREAWVDWDDIRPAEEFMQAIYAAIESADTFIFVLTPNSIASPVCGQELAQAARHNKRLIPVVAQEVEETKVPEALAKLNWIFCRESDDFEAETGKLIQALDTDLEWVRAHTRLLTRAVEWEAKGKNNSFTLRGDDLRDAERWLTQAGTEKERQPTALQTEYIIASRKAAARRQRITLGAVGFGAVVAVVLAIVATVARNRAEGERRNAEAATKRATLARDEAGKLIEFMTVDLRDRLQPIVRLDLLDDVNRKVRAFYDSFASEDESSELLRQQGALFNNQGNIARAQGKLAVALQNYRDGVTFFERRTRLEPGNAIWQRNLSISLGGVAEVLRYQGDLAGARQTQGESVGILEKLAREEASSTVLADDLAGGYVDFGDVQRELGDFAGASKSYRDAVAISERLTEEEPENSSWQRNLALRYERVGGFQMVQGDLAAALQTSQRSLAIVQKLTQKDPDNAGWQSDLATALMKVAEVQSAKRDFSGALKCCRDSLAILEKLSQHDPSNADWQRTLSIVYNQIGDLLNTRNDVAGALQNYRNSLAIREKLVRQDPKNAWAQRDLSIADENLGKILSQQGDSAGALASFRRSLAMREQLTKQDPLNSRWQRDLAVAHSSVGDMQNVLGDFKGALQSYRATISIAEAIGKSGDIAAEDTLWLNYFKLGKLQSREEDLRPALQSYRQALALAQKRSSRNPDNTSYLSDLAMSSGYLGMTQRLVKEESDKEAREIMVKARDILRGFQKDGKLTPPEELLLGTIEQSLRMPSLDNSETPEKDEKAASRRRGRR